MVSMETLYSKVISRGIRKPAFSIGEHKGAGKLCDNLAADRRIRFRYIEQYLYFIKRIFQASSHLFVSVLIENPEDMFC